MHKQTSGDYLQHRFATKRMQEKDDERSWDAGNREPWTAISSRAGHMLQDDYKLFSLGGSRTVTDIKKATTVGFTATVSFFLVKILLELVVDWFVSLDLVTAWLSTLSFEINHFLHLTITIVSITASFKFTRQIQQQVFKQLFADRLYEVIGSDSAGQIERDSAEHRESNKKLRRLILPTDLPSGETRFEIGTLGVQISGDHRTLQVDWKRVEDVILFKSDGGRLVSGQELRVRVEELYNDNSEDIDVAPTIGLRLSKSIHYNDFSRLFIRAQEAYSDRGSEVELIRIVLRDRAEEGERRHHATLGERSVTNVSEEIIIPKRFFTTDPASDHMAFFFNAVKFMIVRQNPNNFS